MWMWTHFSVLFHEETNSEGTNVALGLLKFLWYLHKFLVLKSHVFLIYSEEYNVLGRGGNLQNSPVQNKVVTFSIVSLQTSGIYFQSSVGSIVSIVAPGKCQDQLHTPTPHVSFNPGGSLWFFFFFRGWTKVVSTGDLHLRDWNVKESYKEQLWGKDSSFVITLEEFSV